MAQYQTLLDAENLPEALCEHFGYLADSPGAEESLAELMSQAVKVRHEDDVLIVEFAGKSDYYWLQAYPPETGQNYGDDFAYLFKKHRKITCGELTLIFGKGDDYFDGPQEFEEEYSAFASQLGDKSISDLVILIQQNSDLWLGHPNRKNKTGAPVIVGLMHDDPDDVDEASVNAGTLFMVKVLSQMAHATY